MATRSAPKPGRVVRHKLADGSVREYHYPPWSRRRATQIAPDSVSALVAAFKGSPDWATLAPATQATYGVYLRHLDACGHLPVATVRRRDLLSLRDALAEAVGTGAASGFARTASRLFGWAVDRDWIEHSPAERVRALPGGHLKAWSEADLALALGKLPEPLRRVVVLAVHTGQRRGDLVALGWNSYDGRTIRLRQQKTGVEMAIPASAELRVEMERWRAGRASTRVLTNASGLPWKPNRLSQQMHYHLSRTGLHELGVHGLRKLAAARLAAAGCTVHQIAAITGHKTLGMVQLYTASVDQARLAETAIARLEGQGDKRLSKRIQRLR